MSGSVEEFGANTEAVLLKTKILIESGVAEFERHLIRFLPETKYLILANIAGIYFCIDTPGMGFSSSEFVPEKSYSLIFLLGFISAIISYWYTVRLDPKVANLKLEVKTIPNSVSNKTGLVKAAVAKAEMARDKSKAATAKLNSASNEADLVKARSEIEKAKIDLNNAITALEKTQNIAEKRKAEIGVTIESIEEMKANLTETGVLKNRSDALFHFSGILFLLGVLLTTLFFAGFDLFSILFEQS